jgi:negative regulator of genetic competence, sporulation and motility
VSSDLPVIKVFLSADTNEGRNFSISNIWTEAGKISENIYEKLQMVDSVQNSSYVERNTGLWKVFTPSVIRLR